MPLSLSRAAFQGKGGLTFRGASPGLCQSELLLGLQGWVSSAPTRGSSPVLGRDWAGEGQSKSGGEAPECAPSSCCSPSLNRCTTFVSLCLSCPLPLQLHQGGSSAFLSLCLSPGHPAESLPPPEGDLAAGSICPTLPSTAWELLPGHSPFINL